MPPPTGTRILFSSKLRGLRLTIHKKVWLGAQAKLCEERLNVAVQEVLGDASGDDGAVVVEGLDVGFTHHRGDFETNMEKLADVRII